jgi:pimeloyl-ACP methyl ester carboxylesterase
MTIGRAARDWWSTKFEGKSFMGVGLADPVLGKPVMDRMRESIRNCPPALEMEGVGHFVQEQGEPLARAALKHWGDL